jgi:NitT/TauT family transport system permease protein
MHQPVDQSLIAPPRQTTTGLSVSAAMIVIAAVAPIAEWLLTMIEHRLLISRPETTVNE